MSRKVSIIDGSYEYRALFTDLGFEVVDLQDKPDLLCFTGGEDVTPELYGDQAHHTTFNNPRRDAIEKEVFNRFMELPKVGICRGGQFLNVMNGGRMYQDVSNHCGDHELEDVKTKQHILVSSTHHQMMMPAKDAELVAIAHEGGYRQWFDKDVYRKDMSQTDYEVLYYPKSRSLCFQPHPEFRAKHYQGMYEYFGKCLSNYLQV